MKLKSWKTTSTGIVLVVGGIVRLIFAIKSGNITEEAIITTVGTIISGIGFIFAKDTNVTGGNVQQ